MDVKDVLEDLPDDIRGSINLPRSSKRTTVKELGFGDPHPNLTITPALRRQMDLFTNAKDVDYFVFDKLDRPFPFTIDDIWEKFMFRAQRTLVIVSPDRNGMESIAQYVLKFMSQQPGFSRDLILGQFEREYGSDIREKLRAFEKGAEYEGTVITFMSRSFGAALAKVLGPKAR